MKQDPLLSGPAQLLAKATRGTDIRVARMENVAPKIVIFAVFWDIFRLSLDVGLRGFGWICQGEE
jgi:hypothetical protein